MPTISQLTAVSSLTDTDQVPVYSTNNGDARKASLSTLRTYLFRTASVVSSVTATAPVVSSGGINPVISMDAASESVNGYLTTEDWNTFNSKQTALVSGTNIKTVGGASLLGSGDVGTLGVAYGGTGLSTLTSKAVMIGNGTSAPTFVSGVTNGNVLTFNGTDWVSSALPAGAVTSVSGGTTGLTPNTPTGGDIVLSGTLAATNGGTGQTTLAAARGDFGSGVSSHKTANYTAVAGDVLACDTIAVGAFTVTLPLSPVAGDAPIKIYDAGTTDTVDGFATNNLTIARNGNTIHTLAEDVIVSTKGVTIVCEYVNGTWRLYNG